MKFTQPDGGAPEVSGESWVNLPTWVELENSQDSDREDPDIVALGDAVEVMGVVDGGTQAWTTAGGSSFAAPAMASMAALLKEECMGNMDDKWVRAIMMTAAWYYNPDGLKYSTSVTCPTTFSPHSTPDCKDGAGSPAAQDVMLWCGSTMSGLTVAGGTSTLETNNCRGPCGTMATSAMNVSTVDAGTDVVVAGGGEGGGPVTDGVGTTNWYYEVGGTYSLGHNDRIRATVTWDTCTDGSQHPSVVGNDIDLWLCPTSGLACVAWSRSLDNNWEGFDWTRTSAAAAENYEVRIGYNEAYMYGTSGTLGCPDTLTNEPIALAVVHGASSSFDEYTW